MFWVRRDASNSEDGESCGCGRAQRGHEGHTFPSAGAKSLAAHGLKSSNISSHACIRRSAAFFNKDIKGGLFGPGSSLAGRHS
ncbi:unnamed protein product, partial [Ectocarpus sp. 13 AM-2016]